MNIFYLNAEPELRAQQHVVDGDAVQSYRNYYQGSKSSLFAWKNRPIPDWIA